MIFCTQRLIDLSRTGVPRSPDRVNARAGHYGRKLLTKAGKFNMRCQSFGRYVLKDSQIDSYKRCEAYMENVIIERLNGSAKPCDFTEAFSATYLRKKWPKFTARLKPSTPRKTLLQQKTKSKPRWKS